MAAPFEAWHRKRCDLKQDCKESISNTSAERYLFTLASHAINPSYGISGTEINKGLRFTAAKQQVQHRSEQANVNMFLKKEKM